MRVCGNCGSRFWWGQYTSLKSARDIPGGACERGAILSGWHCSKGTGWHFNCSKGHRFWVLQARVVGKGSHGHRTCAVECIASTVSFHSTLIELICSAISSWATDIFRAATFDGWVLRFSFNNFSMEISRQKCALFQV